MSQERKTKERESEVRQPEPLKPSEREGRPESPRKRPTGTADNGAERGSASRQGNALPDREVDKKADAGASHRDTLHVPMRTNRSRA